MELKNDDVPSHPPPPYQGQETGKSLSLCLGQSDEIKSFVHTGVQFTPPTYSKPMPLPTYTQSEKYEKDGVLEMEMRREPELEDLNSRPRRVVLINSSSPESDVGTCCEFTFFFLSMYMI